MGWGGESRAVWADHGGGGVTIFGGVREVQHWGAVDGGGGSGLGVLEVFSSLDCSVSGSSGMGWGWVVTAVV